MSATTAATTTNASNTGQKLLTEAPISLKQLARLIVRGFYTIEDSLIIDMLVRNPCIKEDDICELLKFEKKQLRSRIAILKNDKFIQVRLRMETGPDGKAQKVNYYFINYKTFVNVVKYKLDLMRKRMETEERDATSRASFKCTNCNKLFTDLEADQLFDFSTGEFHCTFCGHIVEEDVSALPKKDSRLLLAKFNEQLQPLYDLLRDVEDVKLAPEVLEPEPVDIDTIRGINKNMNNADTQQWSGEATRKQGFAAEETRIDVSIGDSETSSSTAIIKDRPVWMTESTVITNEDNTNNVNSLLNKTDEQVSQLSTTSTQSSNVRNKKENEDIMSVLLQHETQASKNDPIKGLKANNEDDNSSDSSEDEKDIENAEIPNIEFMNSDSENDAPIIYVCGRPHSIDDINHDLIAQMTPQEKENYIQVYQDYYSHMYD